jgi:hypothetical protein
VCVSALLLGIGCSSRKSSSGEIAACYWSNTNNTQDLAATGS